MDDASRERRQRMTGIALMCGAVASFALLDTTAKYLNLHMDTLQVVWARYTGAFLFPFIVSNPWTRPGLMVTTRPVLQLFRSLLLLGSTICNFVALRYLQLDETVAIQFSAPFFVAALSGPILGEWVRWRRWAAICVGFVGVLVVTRPGAGGIHWAASLSLLATASYAIFAIITRILARTDSNETTLFYSNLVGVVVMLPIVLFVWVTPTDPLVVALMVVTGAIGRLRALSLDRRSPACARLRPRPVHLYRVDLDGFARLRGVRRHAQPLDHRRLRDRGRLGTLPATPRAGPGAGNGVISAAVMALLPLQD